MYRILYDRVFNCWNENFKYNNKDVSSLSIYVRIKVYDKNDNEIGLSKTNDKEYHSIISDIFYNTDFTIDKNSKLINITINNDDNFVKTLLINHVNHYNISIAKYMIDTFDDATHCLSIPNEVDEKTFIEFLIKHHKDLENPDNEYAQNCSYEYEEVK